ncbi:MAG: hypothetical protein KatS3mg035_1860 [Bacteroidia bacterium]|nr:MAG: hypothetical protein KatS3mg035_1860 [Bacteroidia bacterium]
MHQKKLSKKFYQIGEAMGMGFQLQDDYLDVFGNTDFGKKIGGDILENKKTFLLISALQEAIGSDYDDLQYWLKIHNKPEEKILVVKSIFERTGVGEKCINTSNMYFQHAYQLIQEVENYANVQALRNYFSMIQNRNK